MVKYLVLIAALGALIGLVAWLMSVNSRLPEPEGTVGPQCAGCSNILCSRCHKTEKRDVKC